MSDDYRIDIGFTGGGSAQVQADKASWEDFESSLKAGGGWVTVPGKDDTSFLVNTEQVVYARVKAPSKKTMGFGGTST